MCVKYSNTITSVVRKQAVTGKFVGFKVYNVSQAEAMLYSPFQTDDIGGFVTGPGIYVSSRLGPELNEEERRTEELQVGFHVFLHRQDAKKFAADLGPTCRVVPVVCKTEDLVGAGFTTWNLINRYVCAVFSKIEITQEAFEEAIPTDIWKGATVLINCSDCRTILS